MFYRARWPNGFRCPRCGCPSSTTIMRKLPLYQCSSCRHQTSLIAGTVMHRSKTPLRKWMIAISLLSREASVNAVTLASIIRVTYKTSWLILHKIRAAISEFDCRMPVRESTAVGIKYYDRFKSMRRPRQHLLAIATSVQSANNCGYFKMKFFDQRHQEEHSQHPLPFLSLSLIQKQEFTSRYFIGTTAAEKNNEHPSIQFLPYVRLYKLQSLIPAFKRARHWINLTFNGLATKHKQMYWDEWCFRYNYRSFDKHRTDNEEHIYQKLLCLCIRSSA